MLLVIIILNDEQKEKKKQIDCAIHKYGYVSGDE